MKFDINRMCDLAGIGRRRSSAGSSGLLSEGVDFPEADYNEANYDEMDMPSIDEQDEEEKKDKEDEEDKEEMAGHDDQLLEIDEKVLVQELRRMKKIMSEAKRKSVHIKRRRKESLQEAQLKAIIDQEVKNVLKDLNLNSGWVYGNKRPTQSKKGFVNHGSFLKGIGFK